MKKILSLFSIVLFSYSGYTQTNNTKDSLLYDAIRFSLNEYPASLYKDSTSTIIFVKVLFNSNLEADSILFYNTSDTCVKRVVSNSLHTVSFKKYYGSSIPLFIPIAYLDNDAMWFNSEKKLLVPKEMFEIFWKAEKFSETKMILPVRRISETRDRKPRS